MIAPLISWLAYIWASLTTVIQHDWLFYAIAVPVVGFVAWAWSRVFPGKGEKDDEE